MQKFFRYLTGILFIIIITSIYFLFFSSPESEGKSIKTVRTVTDSIGRKVTLPAHPQRVVMLNPSNLEIYYAAGGKVIAKPSSTSYPTEIAQKIKDVPEIGIIHSPNLEKILSLQPDLIIGVNIPFHTAMSDALKNAGIPLFINSINSYEDVLHTLDFYGELANTADVAAAKRKQIEAEYDTVIAGSHNKLPPRSLIIFGSTDSFSMATKKSFSGDLVKRLGGGNIADLDNSLLDAYVPLSMEYITKKDPEVIMIITMGNPQTVIRHFRTDLAKNPIWNEISAVRNGRIHQLPANLFTVNPGTQTAEAMSIISSYLYPQEVQQ